MPSGTSAHSAQSPRTPPTHPRNRAAAAVSTSHTRLSSIHLNEPAVRTPLTSTSLQRLQDSVNPGPSVHRRSQDNPPIAHSVTESVPSTPTLNMLGISWKRKKRCRPDYRGLSNKTHGTVKQPVSWSSRDPILASTTPGNFVSYKSKTASNRSFSIAGPSAGMLQGIPSAAFIEAMTTGIPRSRHITGLAMKGGL